MLLTQAVKNKTTFQLKGSMYTITTLKLLHYDHSLFCKQLTEKVKSSPKFFTNAPVMLDLTAVDNLADVNLNIISTTITDFGMILIGIRSNANNLREQAKQLNLAIFSQTISSADEAKPTTSANTQKTQVVQQPIRSGQQIYAKGGDLIILNSVSQGAEVLADGHIHIYGSLRGRALAGVQGDVTSMIFCQYFDAELVAIAGRYMISEDLQTYKQEKSVRIALIKDNLKISTLTDH
ncbi:MAG: septum site-determining protein MinC [Pseudomonadota bacterium]